MSTRHTLREWALFALVLIASGITGRLIATAHIWAGL